MEIAAFIVSAIAVIVSIVAIVISVIHKKKDINHAFYDSFEKSLSDILFNKYPKAFYSFIDSNNRTTSPKEYSNIDDCFHELYNIVNCLRMLDLKEAEDIYCNLTSLEDKLLRVKNEGYNEQKINEIKSATAVVYKKFKDFCIKH